MRHVKGMCAITNPLVNSYKRLVPGFEAPVYIAWSGTNRSPLIRIPAERGEGTRIELRCPDPSANPYLVLAVCLAAGLDGIQKQIMPPAAVDRNIFNMTEEEIQEEGLMSCRTIFWKQSMKWKGRAGKRGAWNTHQPALYQGEKRKNGQNIPARFPDGNWISIFTAYKFSSRDGS